MPKLQKRVIPSLLLAVIIMVLSFAGCGGSYTPSTMPWTGIAPENLTQQQWQDILSVALEYHDHLNNYKLDVLTSTDTNVTGGSNPWELSLSTDVAGVKNIAEDQTEIARSSSMKMQGKGQNGEEQEVVYDMYFMNDWAYVNMMTASMGTFWVRTKRSSNLEKTLNFNIVDQQVKQLNSPASIVYLKTEKVNDVDCYVLSITPNNNELANWLDEQDTGYQNLDWQKIVNDAGSLKSFECDCYLAKDSYQISRIEVNIVIALTPEQVEAASTDFDTAQININMTMTLHDFNVPNTITVPGDAYGAKEVSNDVFLNE